MKHLVLAGGGHGHILLLKKFAKKPLCGVEVTLITDYPKQYYSGMLAGYVEGIYCEEEMAFDVRALAEAAGVNYIESDIRTIDREKNAVITDSGEITYDILSMNLGVRSQEPFLLERREASYVKPIARTVAFKKQLDKASGLKEKRLVIVGGGASGVELALALKAAYDFREVLLLTSGEVAKNMNTTSRERLRRLLKDKDIDLYESTTVRGVDGEKVQAEDEAYAYDYLILSTGFTGVEVEYKGFDVTESNYVYVDSHLKAAPNVFAMGDMVTLKDRPRLPKAGVFAIRQAPVLYHNLMKALAGEDDLRSYTPQEKYLQIINGGGKKALFNRGSFSLYGHIPWLIKDMIDRRYMK